MDAYPTGIMDSNHNQFVDFPVISWFVGFTATIHLIAATKINVREFITHGLAIGRIKPPSGTWLNGNLSTKEEANSRKKTQKTSSCQK